MSIGKTKTNFLIAFRNGEEGGFNHFFHLYYKAVYLFARQYADDDACAEDIVIDAFIQLWSARERIENESHLKNYLYRGARNLAMDQRERKVTRERYLKAIKNADETEENAYYKNIVRTETIRQLEEAIGLLPSQCKKIFSKLYIEGKTVKETAGELGLTISTINNQKSRGLKILRERFMVLFILCFCSVSIFIFQAF